MQVQLWQRSVPELFCQTNQGGQAVVSIAGSCVCWSFISVVENTSDTVIRRTNSTFIFCGVHICSWLISKFTFACRSRTCLMCHTSTGLAAEEQLVPVEYTCNRLMSKLEYISVVSKTPLIHVHLHRFSSRFYCLSYSRTLTRLWCFVWNTFLCMLVAIKISVNSPRGETKYLFYGSVGWLIQLCSRSLVITSISSLACWDDHSLLFPNKTLQHVVSHWRLFGRDSGWRSLGSKAEWLSVFTSPHNCASVQDKG